MAEPARQLATTAAETLRRGITLTELTPPAAVNLRGLGRDPAFVRAAGSALGCILPLRANTVETTAGRTVVWLGPDEWLVLGEPGQEGAIADALEVALAGQHVSVVDVSGNRALLRLEGDGARGVLEKGCSLDLHPRKFTPGCSAQTLLARAQVILVARGADAYDILPRRSFAPYLRAWLEDAMIHP